MISVCSITGKYILQPALLSKHRKTLEWLSEVMFWKIELAFFQKLLDQNASKFLTSDEKKQIAHFQTIIIYYKGELINLFASRLRLHEKKLAEALLSHDETKVEYFKEHDDLMEELESIKRQLVEYKTAFSTFIEKAM
jgi:hypothetical protein